MTRAVPLTAIVVGAPLVLTSHGAEGGDGPLPPGTAAGVEGGGVTPAGMVVAGEGGC